MSIKTITKKEVDVYQEASYEKEARPVTGYDKLILPIYFPRWGCGISSTLEYLLEDEKGNIKRYSVSNDKKAWKLIKKISDRWHNVHRYIFKEIDNYDENKIDDWTIEKVPIEQTDMFSSRPYLKEN